jgi:site-specific DNA recombinase
VRVVAQPLEDLLVEAVMQRVDGPELAEAIRMQGRDDEQRAAAEGFAAAEAKLEELAAGWAEDRISRERMVARKGVGARLEPPSDGTAGNVARASSTVSSNSRAY